MRFSFNFEFNWFSSNNSYSACTSFGGYSSDGEFRTKYNSGTIIHWKNCDRLTYKRANTIITHLEHRLGRIYRHFIGNGITINFRAYNQPKGNYPSIIEDLCRPIRKFDPLFLETGTISDEYNDGEPTSEKFCPDKTETFTDSTGQIHKFIIKASYAKEHIQYPGGTPKSKGGRKGLIGGDLYGKVQGISIVRAKRELRIHHFDYPLDNGTLIQNTDGGKLKSNLNQYQTCY